MWIKERHSLAAVSAPDFYVSVKYLFKILFLLFYVPVTAEYKLHAYSN